MSAPRRARARRVAVVAAAAAGVGAVLVSAPAALAVPPPNDAFPGEALPGASLPISATGTNVDATKELSEPATIFGNVGGKSVWWSWTAPSTGNVAIATCGSNFDTLLGVYTGAALPVTPVAGGEADDGGCTSGATQSRVVIPATQGTTYRIAVDGFKPQAGVAASGDIVLTIETSEPPPPPPGGPPNDHLANAEEIVNNPDPTAGIAFGNLTATREAAENNHAGNPGGHSLWWKWTAPAEDEYVAYTCGSDLNTLLGVYSDPDAPGPFPLTEVGSSDDDTTLWLCEGANADDAAVYFDAAAGEEFKLAIDGKFGAATDGILLVQIYAVDDLPPPPPPQAPANDNFATAQALVGTPAAATGKNDAATTEVGEPSHHPPAGATFPNKSIWYEWTAPYSEQARVSTCDSAPSLDTVLAVYTGFSLPALGRIADNDNGCGGGTASEVTFAAIGGTTYYFAVDSYGPGISSGILINVALLGPPPPPEPPPPPPDNDDFGDAEGLIGTSDSATGDNRSADAQTPNEPNHYPSAGSFPRQSIWYRWTAPTAGQATISLCNSPAQFDSVLSVYTGGTLAGLHRIENDDDACTAPSAVGPSRVSFHADAGVTYRIAVDSYAGAESKDIALNLTIVPDREAALPDATDPKTTIKKGPKEKTTKRKAKFVFRSNEEGATFECALKGQPFEPCSSPHVVKSKPGKNKFYVRAIDGAGNVDESPAAYTWKYKASG